MRVLVLAPQPFFTPRGTPFSVYYRTETLAALGEEVDLLTYGQGVDVDIGGVRIVRTPPMSFLGKVPTGPSLLKVLHDAFLGVYAFSLLIRGRYDYVHAHEEAVFIAWILKPLFRFKLVYDMHSSLPEQLFNFGYSRSRAMTALFHSLEKRALRSSDAVIVVCPALLEYASSLVADSSKIVLIENSVFDPISFADDGAKDAATETIQEAKALARAGHPLIVYAGTLERYQGIDLLLEAFGLIGDAYPEARLLVVGGTPRQIGQYTDVAVALGISDRCLFSNPVSPETAAACVAFATMTVSPRRTGTNTPMKVYAQLASGTPIVATRIESHTQVLDDTVATLVEPEAHDLARGIRRVLDDPETASAKANTAQALYENRYSRAVYVAATKKLLADLR